MDTRSNQRTQGARRSGPSHMAPAHMAPSTSAYAAHDQAPRRRRRIWPVLLAIALVAVVAVGGWFVYQHLSRVDLTVNGQSVSMHRGDTVQALIDEGMASPKPGRLLAIDGTTIDETGGETCSVTIGGEPADTTRELTAGLDVTIGDGADVTEDSTTTEEPIPFETEDSSERTFESYWDGSIHLLSDGKDGTRTTRTGSVSGITMFDGTTPAVNAGYRVYTAQPKDQVVALTFDDGPWPETTGQILDILQENNAKATFFTIGNQVADHVDEVKRARDMGCQICTHTWDHASGSGQGVNLTYMSAEEQVEEVQKGFEAISDALGEEPSRIMRAPGGNFYGDIVETLWPYLDAEIGWDVDTEDWSLPGKDAIVEAILSVEPGQVILMHDGGGDRSQTVEALREALPQLVERGYSFVTVDELLAYGVPED